MTFQKMKMNAGIKFCFEKMNFEMSRKRKSQKNTNHHIKCDENDNMHNMLINKCLYDYETDPENSDVNKMLLVLIFLMVK